LLGLFAAKRILQAADGVLNLALRLVSLAFGFQLGVAGDFTGCFLYGALRLIGCAFDPILVQLTTSLFTPI
jgi:hypothetical protein